MRKSRIARTAGFIGTAGLTVALIGAAAAGTGAYFTDSKSGTISGTMGSIKITGYDGGGTDALDMTFTKMLPGEGQDRTVRYQNTGENNQDVWVVFDQTDLGTHDGNTGLNSLGSYAAIHVTANGGAVFDSANLSDRYPCGTPSAGFPDICPLPSQIKLADNLAPGVVGNMLFEFTPGAKFKNGVQDAAILSLRYKLVATQHGIAPNDANKTPITFPSPACVWGAGVGPTAGSPSRAPS
jgi:hypothetical protein